MAVPIPAESPRRYAGAPSNVKIRVLIFTKYTRLAPSSRLRFYQFIPLMERNDFEVEVSALLDDDYLARRYARKRTSLRKLSISYLKRFLKLFSARRADLVWIEQELFPFLPPYFEVALKLFRIPYVVDYDDAAYHHYGLHQRAIVRLLFSRKIDTVMKCAHTIVVGNQYLATRAADNGCARIHVLPTLVDCARYNRKPSFSRDVFRIGWVGSPTTAKYMKTIAWALSRLSDRDDVRIILVGCGDFALDGVRYDILQWSEATEVEFLSNFDVGIAPLPDGPWERGKCGYKILQYMASYLPVVASPVGTASEIVEHGATGFLANSPEEFLEWLELLRRDPALRERMGFAGRRRVEADYSLELRVQELEQIFLRVATQGGQGGVANVHV